MSSDDPTPAQVAAWLEMAESATPGPWRKGNQEPWHIFVNHGGLISDERVLLRMNMANTRDWPWKEDADFIAAARTAVPVLCRALAQRDADLAACRKQLAERSVPLWLLLLLAALILPVAAYVWWIAASAGHA